MGIVSLCDGELLPDRQGSFLCLPAALDDEVPDTLEGELAVHADEDKSVALYEAPAGTQGALGQVEEFRLGRDFDAQLGKVLPEAFHPILLEEPPHTPVLRFTN